MLDWQMRRNWLLTVILAFTLAGPAAAQTAAEADKLNTEVIRLYQAGKYAEAIPLAVRVLALRENSLGPDHPAVATSLSNLAELYRAQGRYPEAEPLYRRAITSYEKSLGPDHPAVATSLNYLALLRLAQGRYAEAEPLMKRSLALREKALGSDHPDVATSLNNLAVLHENQGRYAEAETLHKRSLALREKVLGPDHPLVGQSLNNLAALYRAQGRYAEGEPLYKRSLAISEKSLGPNHPDVATSLNNLAELYRAQGRFAEAEPLYKRSVAMREKALGPDHPNVAASLNNLALLYRAQGRYAEAESLFKRSLSITERALGPDHPEVAKSLNNLADLYRAQGRFAEAEPLHKRDLAITEKSLGPDHPHVAASLNNLALLYESQGRYADAEPLYRRTIAIYEKALGSEHPNLGASLNNLALLYRSQGRYTEAEFLLKRSLANAERALGPDHPDMATWLNNLAFLYRAQGRSAEAEPLYKRSLAIWEKALGPEHPNAGQSLNNLAELYRAQGRTADADPLYRRSLEIWEKSLGLDHPFVATSLNNLAWLALARNDYAGAAESWRRSTDLLQRRAERGLGESGDSSKGETQKYSLYFEGLVKTTHRLAARGYEEVARRAAETFSAAQWGQGSEAAASLAQMAARSAKGSPELATLIRERQDLVVEWQGKDKLLIAARSEPPARRNADNEKAFADRLAAIDTRLAAIDARLGNEFPDYAALASPRPSSIADIQSVLHANEALVLFLDTDARFKPLPEETFLWVVTKSDVRWVRSDLGTAALKREVAALRCGLDRSSNWEWNGEKGRLFARNEHCKVLAPDGLTAFPAFDLKRSYALYRGLFGSVAELLKDKHLLLVPSGPLTTLPFQILVTEEPNDRTTYADAVWLGTRNALTVLPAVSSLKALRSNAKASTAPKPYLGFGNPLLAGETGQDRRAWERQTCPSLPAKKPSVTIVASVERKISSLFRNGLASVEDLRIQPPLPETADELCDVARALGDPAPDQVVYLGERATEKRIKAMSADGSLAAARIVHFATHGLVAGEMAELSNGRAEPALILTPPAVANEQDDGLLTASEIASLKLNADWVLLSACNTAAGNSDGGDALSGLARAFFYAGARALLVSHWAVDSDATVALITKAFAAQKAKPGIGRAEALRQAMAALIAKGDEQAHPAAWAPFIVVGEGGAAN